jgi:hypothetical protein
MDVFVFESLKTTSPEPLRTSLCNTGTTASTGTTTTGILSPAPPSHRHRHQHQRRHRHRHRRHHHRHHRRHISGHIFRREQGKYKKAVAATAAVPLQRRPQLRL